MPSYTRDILGFIQNALQGVYELDDLTVEEIRSGFRFKLPPSQVFKNVATSALDEIPFFVYLFKDYSHTNNSSLESLSVPDLVRLMMLDLKIEHEPFRLAYEVWLSRGFKSNSIIDNSQDIYKSIITDYISLTDKIYKLIMPSQANVSDKIIGIISAS